LLDQSRLNYKSSPETQATNKLLQRLFIIDDLYSNHLQNLSFPQLLPNFAIAIILSGNKISIPLVAWF
jgi:hypothetical protein